jgi:hypothetical protein
VPFAKSLKTFYDFLSLTLKLYQTFVTFKVLKFFKSILLFI